MEILFEGTISTKAVLESGKRKPLVLYADEKKRTRDFGYILAIASKLGVPVKKVSREELDELAGSKSHGGILLLAKERDIPQLQKIADGFVCYINGVEDPYNLGSICRTLYAAGCRQLIVNERNWKDSEKIILRASAGAYERLEIASIKNDDALLDILAKSSSAFICADRKNAVSLCEYKYPENFVLAVGGALRGLGAKLEAASDQNIYIEYGRDFRNALDTASAVAVFAFEYVRQNKELK